MNIEEVKALTDEKLQLAVATLDGCVFYHGRFLHRVLPNGRKMIVDGLPDYLNDLNAMHEAEQLLVDAYLDESEWCDALYAVVYDRPRPMGEAPIHASHALRATAHQRAIAFVVAMPEDTP